MSKKKKVAEKKVAKRRKRSEPQPWTEQDLADLEEFWNASDEPRAKFLKRKRWSIGRLAGKARKLYGKRPPLEERLAEMTKRAEEAKRRMADREAEEEAALRDKALWETAGKPPLAPPPSEIGQIADAHAERQVVAPANTNQPQDFSWQDDLVWQSDTDQPSHHAKGDGHCHWNMVNVSTGEVHECGRPTTKLSPSSEEKHIFCPKHRTENLEFIAGPGR